MIRESIEIDRRPEDVFAYLDQLDRHGEWSDQIEKVRVEPEGPTRVGTRATETRNFGRRRRDVTYEITVHEPPRTSSFRGVDGPIRPVGTTTIEPVGDGSRSRLTIEFDLEGHGFFGKLFAPLARRQAVAEIPKNQAKIKERLEGAA